MPSLALMSLTASVQEQRPVLMSITGHPRPQPPELPDVSLRTLVQIRLGSEVVAQGLAEAWLPLVEQEARRYAAHGGSQEELRSEGLLALWEAVHSYDPQRHRTAPQRYIANQIHRRVRRHYREQKGYGLPQLVSLEVAGPQPALDHRFSAAEQRTDLTSAVRSLAPTEREHLGAYLRLVERGAGPDEAARELARRQGGSFAAWKKRLERIRRKVKERLTAT